MSSFIKLQSVANELAVLHREIEKLGKKVDKVDISKFEITNPFNVKNELSFLKNEATDLIKIIQKMMGGSVNHHTTFRERDSYAYGRYGQLKGEADKIIFDLRCLIRHIDFLTNNAAEGKKTVALAVSLSEMPDLDGDGKQADAIVGGILIIVSIISMLKRIF